MSRLHYFNTAAIGHPSSKVSEVLAAFERIRQGVGRASARSRMLITGEEFPLDGELAGDLHLLREHWAGVNGLAHALCRLVGLTSKDLDVVLTTGTSSAIELVLSSLADERRDLVTTDLEHESEFRVMDTTWAGERRVVPLMRDLLSGMDEAELIDRILLNLNDRSILLISHVVSACGTVMPLRAIAEKVRASYREVIIIVDGAHGPGNIEVDLRGVSVDIYLGSGHKWLRGPETSGYILICKHGHQVMAEKVRKRLIAAYSWFQRENHRAARNGFDPCCECGVGTRYVLPLVGLMVSINELFDKGIKGVSRAAIERRMGFEQIVRESSPLHLVNDHIRLEGSAICSATPLRWGDNGRTKQSASETALRLEEQFGVVCEAVANDLLRFSFCGDETADGVMAAVEGLNYILASEEVAR